MTWSALLLVAAALGTDAFSAAVGIGMARTGMRCLLFLTGTVAGFHILMPLIGMGCGNVLGHLVGGYAVWLGAGVLVSLGLRMVWDFFKSPELTPPPQSGGELLALSACLSLDALCVGFSLGTLATRQLSTIVVTIGLVAGLMTALGWWLGHFLGKMIGRWAELIGGMVLISIGVRMVV